MHEPVPPLDLNVHFHLLVLDGVYLPARRAAMPLALAPASGNSPPTRTGSLDPQLIKGMSPDEAYASGSAKEYEAMWGDSRAFVIAAFKS